MERLLDRDMASIVKKVQRGLCCVPNCHSLSEILHPSRTTEPPLYCMQHLRDGYDTHIGEFAYNERKGRYRWSCCKDIWQLSRCQILHSKLLAHAGTVPITEEHLERARERLARENNQSAH